MRRREESLSPVSLFPVQADLTLWSAVLRMLPSDCGNTGVEVVVSAHCVKMGDNTTDVARGGECGGRGGTFLWQPANIYTDY